jgi:hypothetical protein
MARDMDRLTRRGLRRANSTLLQKMKYIVSYLYSAMDRDHARHGRDAVPTHLPAVPEAPMSNRGSAQWR